MEDFSLGALLNTAKTMIKRYGIDCLCLDPFNYIDNPSKEESNHDRAGDLLRELKKFAIHHDINVTLVAHPRKQDKTGGQYNVPRMYDIAQSSHFYNVPDVGIIVHRTFVDGVNDPVEVFIQKIKHHFRGQLGSIQYTFDRATGRYSEDGRFDNLLALNNNQQDLW